MGVFILVYGWQEWQKSLFNQYRHVINKLWEKGHAQLMSSDGMI
jgi:hypothetical protein